MKSTFPVFIAVLLLGIPGSCKDDPEPAADQVYLKINVNGEEYTASNGRKTGIRVTNCDEKPGWLIQVGKIDASDLYFDLYLNHYENYSDFNPPDIDDNHFVNDRKSSISCEFDLEADLRDKAGNDDSPVLMTGGRNYIDCVTELNETAAETKFAVSGHFECDYYNKNGQRFQILGDYNVVITVAK